MAKSTDRYILPFLCLLVGLIACCGRAAGQVAPLLGPAERMQEMFDVMTDRAGAMSPMFGRLSDEQLAKLDTVDISIVDESKYGRDVLDAFLKQMNSRNVVVTQRGIDIVYLQKLLGRVRQKMTNADRYRKLNAYIIEIESEDAYSIPGGHILVTRGLLDSAGTEAALVGVLAHELSHLEHGHQLLPLKQSRLAQQPLNFQDGMMLVSMVARPFRPEFESEADLDATRWMMGLGYDAIELSRLLERWNQRQDQMMPWQEFVPGFVKSHPDAGKRALEVANTAKVEQRNFPNARYTGAENLKRRLPMDERRFP